MSDGVRNIVLYPRGGLGNQLFQYGAALQLSINLGCQITVDYSLLNPDITFSDGNGRRNLELDQFESKISTIKTANGFRSQLRSKAMTVQRLIGDKAPNLLVHYGAFANERNDQIEVFKSIKRPLVINSYCGSPAYFPACQDELAQQISHVRNPSEWYLQVVKELVEVSPIAVHIRLGDYKNFSSVYGRPDPEYYANAVNLITERIGERPIWLFSDEPEIANEIVRKYINVSRVIDPSESDRAIEHLNLLGRCQGIVCANSSFSWWGGFLSSKLIEDSTVVFPRPMFESSKFKEPENWIPVEWVRLDRRIGL